MQELTSGAKAQLALNASAARVELVPFPVSPSRFLCRVVMLLCILCVSVVNGFALDREAFTFTNYNLTAQLDPQQHRLGVRGKITLRNDSPTPQKVAVLQISSSLDWRSIKAGDKAVQFLTQTYTSDIDHTGALSEAIVTLPQPVPPQGTIDLDIAYEGVILLDATRLTRIGAPDEAAQSSDWDQISADFTAVRGAGDVAWYPIATESANLSEDNSLFDVLGRWKARETGATVQIEFSLPTLPSDASVPIGLCAGEELWAVIRGGSPKWPAGKCSYSRLGLSVPAFVIAYFHQLQRPAIDVYYLQGNEIGAATFADAAEKSLPLVTEWFGAPHAKAKTADLSDPDAAPFESGSLLLTPLSNTDSKLAGLAAAHQLTHAAFLSFRPWIEEGLAHFAQALYLEREKGRQTALDYIGLHASAFISAEKAIDAHSQDDTKSSLLNTSNEELYRSKAMCVWWMLRDMVGDAALKKALAAYKPEDDKDPSYMQKIIAAQSQRDLQWFFDDWVYHDHGLPDFKIDSAFPVKTPTDSYIVTVTVTNSGGAGAEVPIIVKSAAGDASKRIEVRAKSKAVTRIEVPGAPQEIVVNDGSVPESDMTNNVFKLEAASVH